MASTAVNYKMSARPGVVIVPSETLPDVEYEANVGALTCTCPNFKKSRRDNRYRDKHIAVALTREGYIPLPSGRWFKPTDEQLELLEKLAEHQAS